MRAPGKFAALMLLAWCVLADRVSAHGLLARVRTEGPAIVGTAYYSSGERAGGEWVEIFDASSGDAKVAEFSSAADGSFRYDGTAGHRYRVAIHGDEGHFIELSIVVQAGARARLIEDQPSPASTSLADLPAWLVVGGALALTTLLAMFFRVREFARAARRSVNA